MAGHNEPQTMAAAPANAATARLISWTLAAPVADAMVTAAVEASDDDPAVSEGLLIVVAAWVVAAEVTFHPVG